jgi:hypothetical protein
VRPLYVPVRLAATVIAVAAAAGCMSVGDDGAGGSVKPSHSAGQRGAKAPDGGSAVSGGAGYGTGAADGEGGHGKGKGGKGKRAPGKSGGPSVSPSAVAGTSAPTDDKPGKPARPSPPRTSAPSPTRTPDPEPTPTSPGPSASPDPTPEPSSSAHEPPGPQLAQREPAPEAGAPA